jgi:hypothetical protein
LEYRETAFLKSFLFEASFYPANFCALGKKMIQENGDVQTKRTKITPQSSPAILRFNNFWRFNIYQVNHKGHNNTKAKARKLGTISNFEKGRRRHYYVAQCPIGKLATILEVAIINICVSGVPDLLSEVPDLLLTHIWILRKLRQQGVKNR